MRVLFVIALFSFTTKIGIIAYADGSSERVQNSTFEDKYLTHWSVLSCNTRVTPSVCDKTLHDLRSDGSIQTVRPAVSLFPNPQKQASFNAVELNPGSLNFQTLYQNIGPLTPGKVFILKTVFRAHKTRSLNLVLRNKDWKSPYRSAKIYSQTLMGNAQVQTISRPILIPEVDDEGNSTLKQNWTIYAYSNFPNEGSGSVLIKEISLSEAPAIPSKTILTPDSSGNILKFVGDDSVKNKLSASNQELKIPVKPNTTYIVDTEYQILNRKCYYLPDLYIDSEFQKLSEAQKAQIQKWHGNLSSRKGQYCGSFEVLLKEPVCNSLNDDLAKNIKCGTSLIQPSPVGPYTSAQKMLSIPENRRVTTGPKTTYLLLGMRNKGFVGSTAIKKFSISEASLDLTPVGVTPLINFEGMTRPQITQSHNEMEDLKIDTSASELIVMKDGTIEIFRKKSPFQKVATLRVLGELAKSRFAVHDSESGQTIENQQLILSVGSDSTFVGKLKKSTVIRLNLPPENAFSPDQNTYEAGVVLAADTSGEGAGIFFSPGESPIIKQVPGNTVTPGKTLFLESPSNLFELANWDRIPALGTKWREISYHFAAGSTFIMTVFPPKKQNLNEIKINRFHSIDEYNPMTASIGDCKVASGSVCDAEFNEFYGSQTLPHYNIPLFWMNTYTTTDNEDAWVYRQRINGTVYPFAPSKKDASICNLDVTLREGDTCKTKIERFDVAGPYTIANYTIDNSKQDDITPKIENLKQALARAHTDKNGSGQALFYISPQYYYTSDVNSFVSRVSQILKGRLNGDFNAGLRFEGVYLDGLYENQPLKSLELVRRIRRLLGPSGFYVQHSSKEVSVLSETVLLRVPAFDAMANQVLLGEHIRLNQGLTPHMTEPSLKWKFLFGNVNLSNTTSVLLPYNRVLPGTVAPGTPLPPRTQIRAQLKSGGGIYVRSNGDFSKDDAQTLFRDDNDSTLNQCGPTNREYWSSLLDSNIELAVKTDPACLK